MKVLQRGPILLLLVAFSFVACGRSERPVEESGTPAPKTSLASGYQSNPWRLVSVRQDGLLTTEVLYNGCEKFDRIVADESDDEHVVVTAVVKAPTPRSSQEDEEQEECAAELIYGMIRYPLQRPLGSRKLVHAAVTNEEEWSLLGPEYRGTTTSSSQPSDSTSDTPAPQTSLPSGYQSNPWRLVSVRDDRLLTLEVLYGGCEEFDRIEADESDNESIVVTAVVKDEEPDEEPRDKEPVVCPAKLVQAKFKHQLQRPLGSRKLVHAAIDNPDDWGRLEPQYKGTTTPAPRPSR